jgi:hypothetical protein
MLQDSLADNLDGNAGSGGPGGGVAAEIVWPEGTTDHLSGLGTYDPGCLIENRKNPILAGLTSLGGIFPDAWAAFMASLLLFGFDMVGPTEGRIGCVELTCIYFRLLDR